MKSPKKSEKSQIANHGSHGSHIRRARGIIGDNPPGRRFSDPGGREDANIYMRASGRAAHKHTHKHTRTLAQRPCGGLVASVRGRSGGRAAAHSVAPQGGESARKLVRARLGCDTARGDTHARASYRLQRPLWTLRVFGCRFLAGRSWRLRRRRRLAAADTSGRARRAGTRSGRARPRRCCSRRRGRCKIRRGR